VRERITAVADVASKRSGSCARSGRVRRPNSVNVTLTFLLNAATKVHGLPPPPPRISPLPASVTSSIPGCAVSLPRSTAAGGRTREKEDAGRVDVSSRRTGTTDSSVTSCRPRPWTWSAHPSLVTSTRPSRSPPLGSPPLRSPNCAEVNEPASPSGTRSQVSDSTESRSFWTIRALDAPTVISRSSDSRANRAGSGAAASALGLARARSSSNCDSGRVTSWPPAATAARAHTSHRTPIRVVPIMSEHLLAADLQHKPCRRRS
jgi:hypothetical protein